MPKDIRRFSAIEIMAKRLKGEKTLTDLTRVESITDEEIEEAMRNDPDWKDLIGIDWSKAEKVVPTKEAISIRIDRDIILFFKAHGDGYQTRINNVLRHYMNHVLSKLDETGGTK